MNFSDIFQGDGNDSLEPSDNSSSSDISDDESFDTEDEAFPDVTPVNLFPVTDQNPNSGEPLIFEVDSENESSSSLPLCLIFNARSAYNKSDNLNELLNQICPDLCLISETFERQKKRLQSIIKGQVYKNISYYRKNRAPGGGCAIIYNENRFEVQDLEIPAPAEIENVWALVTPKQAGVGLGSMNVKRIAVASYYISPKSRHKQETIEHIIHTIHTLRARFDNEVNFLICGDFNRVDTTDILDSYGALHSILSVPTRKSATLEVVLTDLHTLFHPPNTLPPLEVDTDKQGHDSDHNIVVFAPKMNKNYHKTLNKKTIKTRPLPESQILKFEHDLAMYPWDEEFKNVSVDGQVEIFHFFLRNKLEEYFPEKITKMSGLDKKWMGPHLKQINRAMKREFYKNRRSQKYKKLKTKFKRLKRKSLKTFYSDFVSNLKRTDPGNGMRWRKKLELMSLKVEKISR